MLDHKHILSTTNKCIAYLMFKKGYTNNNFLYLSAVALIAINLKFIFFTLGEATVFYTIIIKAILMAQLYKY